MLIWGRFALCHNIFDKNKIAPTSQRHFEENKRCNYYYNSSARASGILVHFSAQSQTSNNQAGPFAHLKCACSDVFVLVRGKMSQVNYFFSSPFIGTNWFPLHSFVPTRYYHPSTTSPRHTNMFCRLSRKNFACCFLVQSRPNTIANQQRIVIWHYEERWNATCHDLSCLEAGHQPL